MQQIIRHHWQSLGTCLILHGQERAKRKQRMHVDAQKRKRLGIVALFGSLTLAMLFGALWSLYRSTQKDLEAELARRLENLAVAVAADLADENLQAISFLHSYLETKPDSQFVFLADADVVSVRQKILDLNDRIAVANITLFDTMGSSILDLNPAYVAANKSFPEGIELTEALAGSAVHTALYRSGDQYLMTGFAPIEDEYGELYAVGIEGGVEFFDGLRRLRASLLSIGGISVLLLGILGLFFLSLQNRLARAETAAHRAETLAAMGRMTAGIAHEIRNPLGIIRATASRLRRIYNDEKQPDEKFTFIEEEVDRLDTILTGYLNLAKEDAVQLQRTDLVPLLQKTVGNLSPELQSHDARVELHLPANCWVKIDPEKIQQLLINLVFNSVQAMPTGGCITLSLHSAADSVALRLEDNGPGFSHTVLKRAFEPFYTTKEKGSGLGLAVVQRIVEQHQAEIQLSNASTGGARIDIQFPAKA